MNYVTGTVSIVMGTRIGLLREYSTSDGVAEKLELVPKAATVLCWRLLTILGTSTKNGREQFGLLFMLV